MNNYAFIDGQNLYLAIRNNGWKMDYYKFRNFLKDTYSVTKAFLFIGYIGKNHKLYTFLRKAGFETVFKPVLFSLKGAKGNVDGELILKCMIELENFHQAVIISGDGDFHCLIKYLAVNNKLLAVGIPDKRNYSALLRKYSSYFFYINDEKALLEYKKGEHSSRHQHLR